MARCLGPNSPYGCGHHTEHVEAAKKGWATRRAVIEQRRGDEMGARVVFVSADLQKGLGDWVMSLPAPYLLRQKWGDYVELVCICPEPLVPLAEATEVFNQVLPYTLDWCERYAHALRGALAVLALMDSDIYVHDNVAGRLARYDIRQPILRNRFWKVQQHHALMVARNLGCLLGYDPQEPLAHPLTCWQSPEGHTIAIHAGCGSLWRPEAKNWPYFYPFAKRMQADGWDVVQIVGPSDPVLDGVPVWQGSLMELAQFLIGCQGFVGNDSGPGHLAGALGLPTHILFGFTDPELWHPCGPRVTWSRAASHDVADVTADEVYYAVIGKMAAYQAA